MSFLPTLGTTLVKPTSSPAFPTTPSRAGLDELASHVVSPSIRPFSQHSQSTDSMLLQDRQPDIERRRNLLLELLKTEETYVKRLNILYKVSRTICNKPGKRGNLTRDLNFDHHSPSSFMHIHYAISHAEKIRRSSMLLKRSRFLAILKLFCLRMKLS